MKKLKQICAFLSAAIIFAVVTLTAAWLLMPVRTVYGSTWEQYLKEDGESLDILFFGSSLAYCDIIPAAIWEDTGLHSYVLAGPEQTVPIMYYYAREACQTQNPQLIAAEVTNVFYKRHQNYTKANISYIPHGINRLGATISGAEKEEVFGLLFPLYNYHYSWTEVETDDIRAHLSPVDDLTAGYTLLTKACEPPVPTELAYSCDTDNYKRNIKYLKKLKAFCDKNGIELMLYITPSCGKIPEDALSTLRDDLADIGIILQDLNEDIDALGLDNSSDWYDPLHFNIRGANKFSHYLAEKLSNDYDLSPGSGDNEFWERRAEHISSALDKLN